MRRIERILLACGVAVLAVGAVAAAGRTNALPPRYAPGTLDGPLVELANPIDGRTWAVWAFRNGSEYDLALSFLDSNGGWHVPSMVGEGDRRNQTQPALAMDGRGNVYLAFIDGPERRLLLTSLPVNDTLWSPIVTLSAPDEKAARPVLKVVGDRLVVAYLVAGQPQLLDLPVSGSYNLPEGVSEGPDPFDGRPQDDKPDAPPPPPANDGSTKSPTPKG